jgi:hypothetical protein
MSKLTLGQASKLVGKSKPTISKAVKDGKLSGQKVDGVFQIEKSELVRVYGEVKIKKINTVEDMLTAAKSTPASNAVAEIEKKHLEEKVADLEARLAKAEDKVETAETREREANARVFALIEDKSPKSLMQRLLGK